MPNERVGKWMKMKVNVNKRGIKDEHKKKGMKKSEKKNKKKKEMLKEFLIMED